MEHNIPNFQERIDEIINTSYKILCNKIASGNIDVYNEASLQLQFSVILKSIGQLYEYEIKDRFEIELEKKIDLESKTWKSNNQKARCDIWLSIYNGKNRYSAAIELKYFKKSQGETTTDNRFSILCDIENLEHYKKLFKNLSCYSIVYTDNVNYVRSNSASYINIGEGTTHHGKIISNNREIILNNSYTFSWDIYSSKNSNNGFYFLKINF